MRRRFLCPKQLGERFNACLSDGLGTRKSFEYCKGVGQTGVGEDLGELWEEHHDQSLDLVLIRCSLIRELHVEADQFPIGSYPLGFAHSRPVPPHSTTPWRWSWRQADRS
jgi:hypothetical protein